MNKVLLLKQTAVFALAFVASALAQARPDVALKDSLLVPKNFENYNEFQIDKWGPVTYQGEGRCDILNLYQKSVSANLGYSTIVDYRAKEVKVKDKFSCVAWGLGVSFKVVEDSDSNSTNYGLSNNQRTVFSARGKDAVKKFFQSDSAFLEIDTITPISYKVESTCNVVDFLVYGANEENGFHGIIDIKANETKVDRKDFCTFWGLAVKYKQRDVVENIITKKRVVEIIKLPTPKPDTVYVPKEKPSTGGTCCFTCSCGR